MGKIINTMKNLSISLKTKIILVVITSAVIITGVFIIPLIMNNLSGPTREAFMQAVAENTLLKERLAQKIKQEEHNEVFPIKSDDVIPLIDESIQELVTVTKCV